MRGAQGQVQFFRHARQFLGAADDAIGAHIEMQGVAQVDKAEGGLQQVITVGAPAYDVQEQIELGGSGYVVESHG